MSGRRKLLIVDDNPDFRAQAASVFADREDLVLCEAGDGPSALAVLTAETVAAVLLDLRMPGMDGIEVLRRITAMDETIEVVVITGQGSIDSAVSAMRHGAFHYLTKPVDLEDLLVVVDKALEKQHASYENRLLKEAIRRGGMPEIDRPVVAVSQAMRDLFKEARAVAAMESPVLIHGETGVGKEVIAGYIHRLSGRTRGPFNVLNCAALPESLVDSEFFGHAKGAFTGAVEPRAGIIEVSHQGTLLLDEIGDIDEAAQVRLLRVLEYGLVRRVGATKEIPVDVRIIAATHRTLEALVAQGRFREDLYHRLVVINLRIPPLRERREDIVPLAEFFLDQMCSRYADSIALHESTHALLLDYPWLGNVRELRNVVERGWFATLRDGDHTIRARHMSFLRTQGGSDRLQRSEPQSQPAPDEPVTLSLHELELRHIRRVLEHCAHNRRDAASVLGISERSLYRRLQEMEPEPVGGREAR